MPYDPIILLHTLAPNDVNQLIKQNPPPPTIINPSLRNDQSFQNHEGSSNTQPLKDDIVSKNSVLSIENQQQFNRSSSELRVNGINHDKNLDDKLQKATFSKEQKVESSHGKVKYTDNASLLASDLFKRELVVVIENSYNDMMRDMVNSTGQHPKTRNLSNAKIATNNSSTSSTQNPNIKIEHISNETIMTMTTKSSLSPITPISEVTEKQIKEVSLNNQQSTAEEPSTETNYEMIQHDSSGLSLRRRTISSTSLPTSSLHLSTRRHPRRKYHNHVNNAKSLKKDVSQQVVENNVCNSTSTVIIKESATASLERLQQKQLLNHQSTSFDNFNDKLKKNSFTDNISIVVNTNCTQLSQVDKNIETCKYAQSSSCKKKSNARKRKLNIEESVARKRLLISNDLKDSLATKENSIETPLPDNPNLIKDRIYGFLGHSEPSQQQTGPRSHSNSSIITGRTYWPTSWEYSASTLTGHVQKKATKDSLRKIKLICNMGATAKSNTTVSSPLKINSSFKKCQTSVIQRRGSNNKLMTIDSVEPMSVGIRHLPSTSSTIIKRPRGRPPNKPSGTSAINNKLLQSIIKSISPRKSPRQHASTLAAIMSNKISTDEDRTEQLDKPVIMDLESNKNTLDINGQLDHQFTTTKRRRQCRSITPPPPKLCAQQRTPINAIDHDVVKLRTKNVDLVRRRARDERLRAPFICQQLRKVQKMAEQNRRDLVEDILQIHEKDNENHQLLSNALSLLSEGTQDQIWSSLTEDSNQEPDNMCLQIMYERTGDKRFLYTNLSDDILQAYYQQRNLTLAERLTNNNGGDTMSSDLGTDIICTSNKRKKKRPNMTGWPKEKRRKTIIKTDALNGDSDMERNDDIVKRRRAAAALQQRLRRRRLKLEQQQLANEKKSKVKATLTVMPIRKRPGRRPGPNKKFKTVTYRRTHSNSSSNTTTVKEKKFKIRKPRQQRLPIKSKITTEAVETVPPNTIVKRRCGRPKGSMNRSKLLFLQNQNKTLSSEQQKENVQQSSTGKLKCVISTRNNRVKVLSTSRNSLSASPTQKKTVSVGKSKKSTATFNLPSPCLEPLPSSTTRTAVKKKRLQQQMTSTWDAGRPKRYNHSRNTNNCMVIAEDCCFVGSQPFEQHCPGGGGGLSHNTVLENQKENTVHTSSL